MSNRMDSSSAVAALGALAHDHRLAAGALAERLGLPASSLSFHLAHLHRAGLAKQRRHGRSLIYSAAYPAMNALMGYLTENCCGGVACDAAAACEPSLKSERKTA